MNPNSRMRQREHKGLMTIAWLVASGAMMRTWCLLCSVMLLPPLSPAFARGTHVICQFSGVVNDNTNPPKPIEHTFKFYLDDTNEKLVVEKYPDDIDNFAKPNVHTTMYSDVSVAAEINTVIFAGLVTKGRVYIKIDRVTGGGALGADLLPRGALLESGSCKKIVPPPAKF